MIKCPSNKSETFLRAKYTLGENLCASHHRAHCKPRTTGMWISLTLFSSWKLLAETLAIKFFAKWVHPKGLRYICCSTNLSLPPMPRRFAFNHKFLSFKMAKVSFQNLQLRKNLVEARRKFFSCELSIDGGTSGAASAARLSRKWNGKRKKELIKEFSFNCLRASHCCLWWSITTHIIIDKVHFCRNKWGENKKLLHFSPR